MPTEGLAEWILLVVIDGWVAGDEDVGGAGTDELFPTAGMLCGSEFHLIAEDLV